MAIGSSDNATSAMARSLVRLAFKGALATIEQGPGHPYASLVLVAADSGGAPILLLSSLALHTRNLAADHRASLLIDGTSGLGDPLAGGRVTLIGTLGPTSDPASRRRFLARHPSAVGYADFGDFRFYGMHVERAHVIGGFGRIETFPAKAMIDDASDAKALLDAEADIIAHMNSDHSDALELYATRIASAPAGLWRLVAVDPAGMDLALGERALRIPFPERVLTPGHIRTVLKSMADVARRSP